VICINDFRKNILLCLMGIAAVLLCGCGITSKEVELEQPYSGYYNSYQSYDSGESLSYFASDICVAEDKDIGTDKTHSDVAEGEGVFNITTNEVTYSKNLYDKLYPASTTKILTAYIIISNCNLDDTTTVSDNAVNQTSDSSTCGLSAGDITTVRNLLYGLMLNSGNDAAIALAEYYSGSSEAFAQEMNKVAEELGCTGSHFVNPNGMPDEEHYTTVYDMYLIFSQAIKNQAFVDIIYTNEITVHYTNIMGNGVDYTYSNTNRYVNGTEEMPNNVTVIGGKTGTTNAAGYCLVLYAINENNEQFVSIVFKADTRSDLYLLMGEMLSGFTHE